MSHCAHTELFMTGVGHQAINAVAAITQSGLLPRDTETISPQQAPAKSWNINETHFTKIKLHTEGK